jgi:hypothetical protein
LNGRKLIAKPIGMAAGAAGGAAFRYVWRRADRGRNVPEPVDADRSWRVVLLAAALESAVFAVIHAVVTRLAAGAGREAGQEALPASRTYALVDRILIHAVGVDQDSVRNVGATRKAEQ